MTPDDPRHGTYAGANAHWTAGEDLCTPCAREAARYAKRRKYARHRGVPAIVPITGSRRRLQALTFLGYSYAEIARAMGSMSRENIRKYATDDLRDTITARNAARIDDVYQRLSMIIPVPVTRGDKRGTTIARNLARRNGWVGPLAWDDIDNDPTPTTPTTPAAAARDDLDHVVVVRILGGDPTPARGATTAERRETARLWLEAGRPLRQLGELTGWKAERYIAQTATHEKGHAA